MARTWIAVAALLGGTGVGLGAFGAHGLKAHLAPERLETWHTAVLYHLVHALALLVAAALPLAGRAPRLARWGFLAGTVLFSGSLYLLSLTGATWLGAVTPFGGIAFLGGWAALAAAALRRGGAPPSA